MKKYTQNVESGISIQTILKAKKGKEVEPPKRAARVSSSPFNSQMDCLFCGTMVTPRGASFSYAKTDTLVKIILECCDSRSDEWAYTVKGRIEYYGCYLHAADCIYHHSFAVVLSGLGLAYHYSSRMSQRQSTESLAGPKTKIRSRYS